MHRSLVIAILFCLVGCSSRLTQTAIGTTAPATLSKPGVAELSPQNTRITFIGSALLASHEGTFTRFSGQIDDADPDPNKAHIHVDIDMASVTTEIPLLTRHLKEADFFDVQKFPTASFDSTQIQTDSTSANSRNITGKFTIHGVTKSLWFPARFSTDGKNITLDAVLSIRQSDFAMPSARITTDQVPVTISIRISQP